MGPSTERRYWSTWLSLYDERVKKGTQNQNVLHLGINQQTAFFMIRENTLYHLDFKLLSGSNRDTCFMVVRIVQHAHRIIQKENP